MKDMTLKDLYNPNKITAIYLRDRTNAIVELNEDEGFQEYPRLIEIWQQLSDGRLFLLKRWRKSSILGAKYKKEQRWSIPCKDYIYPKVK